MNRFHGIRCVAIAVCLLFAAADGYAQGGAGYTPQSGQEGKDVIWMPTLPELVDTMLDIAEVTSSDYLIDLGSGDGRVVIAAAKRGATALGIDYNPDLVEFAKRAAEAAGVSANARFQNADFFHYDFSKASVLTLFLLQDLNLELRPKILDMKPGTRIVSNTFDMGDWKPDKTKRLTGQDASSYIIAHLWIVPARVEGYWKVDGGRISFSQEFQKVTGTLTLGEQKMELDGKLDGNTLSFHAGGVKYTGTVSGNTISGTHSGGGSWRATR